MPDQVNVQDFEVFRQFRGAMLKFAQIASSSLSNADSQIARTRSWLENEQRSFWEGQLRKRMEAVTQAREAVRQKKLYRDASGRIPGATEEEKALKKCIAAVEHARERIESIKRWLPKLEKSAGMYRSGVARLAKTLDDVPQAVFLLDRLAHSLEEYVQIETPEGVGADSAAASMFDGTASRGGDMAVEPPESVLPPTPAQSNIAPGLPGETNPSTIDSQTTNNNSPNNTPPEDQNVPHGQ